MFENILGQSYAVTVLENAVRSGRFAGAYLFVGPDGVGKTTTALQFAKQLCGVTAESGRLSQAVDAGTHPDLRVIEPQGPSRILRIGQLWPRDGDRDNPPENALLRDLHFEPMAGPRRVFLIKDAEGLNEASGNSLLKTLEEPPLYAHFILTATSTAAVLPTIVSRCQVIRFGLVPTEAIEMALVRRFEVAPELAHFLAIYCEGRLGRAAALARAPALRAGRETLLDLARDLATAPPIKSFKIGEEFRKASSQWKITGQDADEGGDEKTTRAPILHALDLLGTYYRDLLALAVMGPHRAALINIDRRADLVSAASRYTSSQLQEAYVLLAGVRRAVERNANAQIALEALFTRLTLLAEPLVSAA